MKRDAYTMSVYRIQADGGDEALIAAHSAADAASAYYQRRPHLPATASMRCVCVNSALPLVVRP